MEILLGNTAVVEVFSEPHEDPEKAAAGEEQEVRVRRPDLGSRITIVSPPEGTPDDEILRHVRDLWQYHSDADGPEWVESDDEHIATSVARIFTSDNHVCVVGRPEGWQED